ncbi:Oidioi.mRNA.OKI2018_I69.XSR.g15486.t1.cds [Oikopleura dioica]|uniref:Oidioi.mRNA.OKI2018_I69.XSR.g15486.t1.cds n=1 Tax=Oikopleura dioica TaxID=34765 RepID=A0ABN7SD04_OIKDI|nr:Oidioi.mRNA.OKI2018_I69.XSR.g15486.t1.cds [Oikopleura dioica]
MMIQALLLLCLFKSSCFDNPILEVAGSSEILKEALFPISYYIIGGVLAICFFLWLFVGLIYHIKLKNPAKVAASAPKEDPSPIGTVGRNGIYLIPHDEFSQTVTEDFESYSTSKTSEVMRRVREVGHKTPFGDLPPDYSLVLRETL